MKKGLVVAAAAVLMLSLATGVFAQATQGAAPTGVVREREAVMTATVVAVDLQNRYVTLKGPDGELRDIKVGEEAVNLPQVKVGDLVTVKFYESIAVEVIKPGTVMGAGEKTAIVRAKPGEMPGGMAARQVVRDGHHHGHRQAEERHDPQGAGRQTGECKGTGPGEPGEGESR